MADLPFPGVADPYEMLGEPEPFCEHGKAEGLGFVYFIGPESGEGPVKIGWAYRPHLRIVDLQCGSPVPLVFYVMVIAKQQVEFGLHRIFAEDRIHGEWFTLSPRLRTAIVQLRTNAKKLLEKRGQWWLGIGR